MLLLAMMLGAAPAIGADRLDFQLMTSPAYQAFARKADATCPARKLRFLHPADLGEMEEDFLQTLPARDRRRVTAANPGFRGCPPVGMSCPAQHLLGAIVKTGLLDSFTQSACSTSG